MSGCNTDVTAGLEMTLGASPPGIEVSGMQHPDLRPGARGQPLCPGLRDDDVLLVHQNIAPPAAGIDARLQRQHHARFEDHVFVGDQGGNSIEKCQLEFQLEKSLEFWLDVPYTVKKVQKLVV